WPLLPQGCISRYPGHSYCPLLEEALWPTRNSLQRSGFTVNVALAISPSRKSSKLPSTRLRLLPLPLLRPRLLHPCLMTVMLRTTQVPCRFLSLALVPLPAG